FDRLHPAAIFGDRHHGNCRTQRFLHSVERRHFLDAGPAPGRPQIEQDPMAAPIGKSRRLAVATVKGGGGRWQRRRDRDKLTGIRRLLRLTGFRRRGRAAGRDIAGDSDGGADHNNGDCRVDWPDAHVYFDETARMSKKPPANAAWGGRFAGGPSEIMQRINVSLDVDKRLHEQDIAGSLAHSAMLVRAGIIAREDGERIAKGLAKIRDELAAGKFPFDPAHEDIHLNIEARLAELIGPAAGRLHTARSRNDQVATDFRLWVRDAIDAADARIRDVQAAQPVTFGHHLMAYVEMLGRDRGRFQDARARLNESPLGAAALAGTSF